MERHPSHNQSTAKETVQSRKHSNSFKSSLFIELFTHAVLTFHLPWVLCKGRHEFPIAFILTTGIWAGFKNFLYHLLYMAGSAVPNVQQLVCAKRKELEYSWYTNYQKNVFWSNYVVCWRQFPKLTLSWLTKLSIPVAHRFNDLTENSSKKETFLTLRIAQVHVVVLFSISKQNKK